MKHPYLIDLNDEENWLYAQMLGAKPDGTRGEDQRTILHGQGAHRLFLVTDSVMYPGDDKDMHFHEHLTGYEYFFVDSGGMDLYVDNKKTYVEPGSIIHLQPHQAHGMSFRAPTKYRGFFHDMRNSDSSYERYLLRMNRPDVAKSPDYFARFITPEHDSARRECFEWVEVPASEVSAVRHISRPMAEFKLDGVTMKMITARWENAGVLEIWAAEMEKGFFAEWVEFPDMTEMYYITSGKIQFKVYNEEFSAYPECIVKIPRYASHSIKALEDSVMYDMGGLTRWHALLQDRGGILKNDPERAKLPETFEDLKAKYGCQIKAYGLDK